MLVGPIIGLAVGFFLGSFFLPSNPAPGDGFLLIFTGEQVSSFSVSSRLSSQQEYGGARLDRGFE